MAIGRAVAVLGGPPTTPEWQHKLLGFEVVGSKGAKAAINSKQFVCPKPDLGKLMMPADTEADGGGGGGGSNGGEPEDHHTWWVRTNQITKGEARGTNASCSNDECEVMGKVLVGATTCASVCAVVIAPPFQSIAY
jgi:hypothetical protein